MLGTNNNTSRADTTTTCEEEEEGEGVADTMAAGVHRKLNKENMVWYDNTHDTASSVRHHFLQRYNILIVSFSEFEILNDGRF
jgi:hypothetical protein